MREGAGPEGTGAPAVEREGGDPEWRGLPGGALQEGPHRECMN